MAGVSVSSGHAPRGFRLYPSLQPRDRLFLALNWIRGLDFCGQKIDRPPNTVRSPAYGRGSLPSIPRHAKRSWGLIARVGRFRHTVRHWFATATANSVSNPRIGMALTGHKSHTAYMNYIHGDKEQARALADQLAALAKSLGAAAPNVVSLPKAAEN